MQVEPRVQSSMYNSHQHPSSGDQNHSHPNGAHSDPKKYYAASTNGHFDDSDMHPYQSNPYAMGHGQPQQQQQQQQQRQYQPNQLPPMYPTGGVPPTMPPPPAPGMAAGSSQSTLYPAAQSASQLQSPGQANQDYNPKSLVGHNEKYTFELKVEQQPMRARMCGFGDKDRRPITPPPCVRLIITDNTTGKVMTPEEVDGTFFVLQVDLWDETATREVNIVRSSSTSPAVSISTATTTSFPPTVPERQMMGEYGGGVYHTPDGQPMYAPPGYPMPMGRPGMAGPAYPVGYYPQGPYGAMPPQPMTYMPPVAASSASQSHSMFTRNLIGSLTVNASSLKDTENAQGHWFVLQDLSVRTEGWFRLRMNFIDVGLPDATGLNKGKAPVLASIFSDKFQVYSAKKFPGVIESTPLSKKFADQGIKIPIRKDVKSERDGDDDGE